MKPTNLPPMNSLRAFEAVSRHVNVTQAANELSVSPSAISHLIRRLEENLGVTLVRRSGRNIVLTESGLKLAPDLQEIFFSLRKIVSKTRNTLGKNIVTISLRPYFAAKWLTPRLEDFWAEHPDVELHLQHSNQPIDFSMGNIDFSIEWSGNERPGLERYKLGSGKLTPVFSPLLADAKTISKPEDLFRFALLRETDRDSWSRWFEHCEQDIPDNLHSIYIDDSNVRYQAAIQGQGIELGCIALIQDDLKTKLLVAPFDVHIDDRNYYLFQRSDRQSTEAELKFKQWILKQVNSD